jgi:hypothetical protein
MPRYAERAFQVPQRNPNTKLCAQIPRTLSSNTLKKDWHLPPIGAVLSVHSGSQGAQRSCPNGSMADARRRPN